MSKVSKKGRNPGAVDNWLDTLGLYRKNVAYDETCLFRAVSEQLFDCQVYHERVRRDCILYARENYEQFEHLETSKTLWNEHLNKLEKHMVVCGDIELNIISRKYKRDVVLFDASKQQIVDFTKRNLPNVFLLCLMDRDHFDVVYKVDHIAAAGFCQSIIYKILYEDVFKITDVDEIVNSMLYDKNILPQCEMQVERNKASPENNESALERVFPYDSDGKASTNIAPFPFKVAKALDPNIYRNIEYDSWGEMRREMRLGEWYYGDDKLILGTKCIFNDVDTDEKYDCYIQEILKGQNKCVVFLTKVAQKKTVDYSSLSPEDDAKPWPLPYRFMKNCVISSPNTNTPISEKSALKTKRRYKDKKRTKSESSIISTNVQIKSEVENVDDYVGVPLHMQNLSNSPSYRHQEASIETQTDSAHQSNQESCQPEAESAAHPLRYQQHYDGAHWQPYLTSTPDQFVWPQSPIMHQHMFSFKPLIASAPVTPNVVPYHDTNYPFYYNYHVEPYQTYPQWSSPPPFELQPPPPPKNEIEKADSSKTQQAAEQVNPEPVIQHCSRNEVNDAHGGLHERPPPLNFTPQSPSVEVYPQMMLPPGTPVLYTTTPHEMTEMVMPSTPIMYTAPHMEIPYMSSSPFIYPPTPPATWYPAGVTPQGFFFPPRHI